MTHELRDFGFVLVGIVSGLEGGIELNRVFGAFTGFGEIHHAFLEVGELNMVESGLLNSLLDEEIFGFTDVH